MKSLQVINQYCIGIQAGIQGGHAQDALWSKYTDGTDEYGLLSNYAAKLKTIRDFSRSDKTVVLLNGGDHSALKLLIDFYQRNSSLPANEPMNNPYPWCQFTEPGLNDSITAVAIILLQIPLQTPTTEPLPTDDDL